MYSRDFDPATSATLASGVSATWSNTIKKQAPNSNWFLGDFGNQTVTLTLNGLPTHSALTVEFDLYLIRSWDGNDSTYGADGWSFKAAGTTVVDSTFRVPRTASSNSGFTQNYSPDNLIGPGSYESGTGAALLNSLGYTFNNGSVTQPLDAVYHFKLPVSHSGSSITLTFAATGLQALTDESWGLDNVKVATGRPPVSAGDTYETTIGRPITVPAAGVLTNDSDPDGDTITASLTAAPANGSVSLASNGSFIYTPNPGFVGTDTFKYRAFDGVLYGNEATVTVNVTPQVVTIQAATPVTDEAGTLPNGDFVVTRTGSTVHDLVVNLTVPGGTATSGSDYTALPTSVVIPAGYSSAHISLAPINDTICENDEIVVLGVAAGTYYTLGAQTSATVTIKDDDFRNALLMFIYAQSCSCGCPCPPNILAALEKNAQAAVSAARGIASQFSMFPVRYADGTVKLTAYDLSSEGVGAIWGQTRSWSNGAGYSTDQANGSGWVVSQAPRIIQIDGLNTLGLIIDGQTALFFDLVGGSYVPKFGGSEKLAYSSGTDKFTLTTAGGDALTFGGFSTTLSQFRRGQFESVTTSSGNTTSVVAWTPQGNIAEVRATVGGVTDSYLSTYNTSGVNIGLLASVALRRSLDGGTTWTPVRSVEYSYYDGIESHGNAGDLKTAVIKDASGSPVSTDYYRYYTAGESGGYQHGLKYAVLGAAYDRLKADAGGTDAAAQAVSDATASVFADHYFEYDSTGRMTTEVASGAGCSVCSAGQGTFTNAYTTSTNADGPNSWKTKTVETLPDGNQNIVYTNAYGDVMLKAFRNVSTGEQWVTYYQFDANFRVVLTADPSAMTGYDDTYADLVHIVSGNAQYVSDSTGLVRVSTYGSSTTATSTTPGSVAGYLESTALRRGETGTNVPQQAVTYLSHSAGGSTVYVVASDTSYRNDDGTGAITTNYGYTYFSGSNAVLSQTVTLPVVGTGQNGSGTASTSTVVYDAKGRPAWTRDAAGVLGYTEYDSKTGAVVKSIADVNTANTADFTSLPSGWTTPTGAGKHLVSTFEVDGLGRTTKAVDPLGRITYTVYNDANFEVRVYAGWNTTTHAPTGPIAVSRENRGLGYTEAFLLDATPTVDGSGRPTGLEAVTTSAIRSLTRSLVNSAGQQTGTDAYTTLSGTSYSTTGTTLGTSGTNYLRTRQDYDMHGLPNRVIAADGTISRTVYDGLGRPVSEWIGNNDTPTSGYWSPSNPAGMVKVREYEYDDGGIGDGLLTKVTEYPGGSAAPIVTLYEYDWRGRAVATKQGAQTTESTTVNRPITYLDYDNLGQVVRTRIYDGDGVALVDADNNGVPDTPSASLLRGQSRDYYDDWGRVYRSETDRVNQTTGSVASSPDVSQSWFDNRGLLVKTLAPNGLAQKYAYDSLGRLTVSFTSNAGGDAVYTDALNVTGDTVFAQAEYTYDAASQLILTVSRDRKDLASGTGALTSTNARTTYAGSYYDLLGRTMATVDVGTNGGTTWTRPGTVPASSSTVHVTTFTYGSNGLVSGVTAADGVTDTTTYDLLGRTVTQTAASGTSVAFVTTNAYDSGGRLFSVTAPGSRTTQYGYDNFGRLDTVVERAGTSLARTTKTVYDNLGRTITVTEGYGSSLAVSTAMAYDPVGRMASTTEASGTSLARTSSSKFDVFGRTVSSTDPRGNVTNMAYDDPNRKVVTTDALGNAWTSQYDNAGNLVSSTDPLSHTTTNAYDLQGRLTSNTTPLLNTTKYRYLVSGDRDQVEDALGHTNTTVYDRFGQVYQQIDALGQTTQYGYDRVGRTVSMTDARGTVSQFGYDALGRNTTTTEAVGLAEQRTTTNAYNAAGDLESVTDPMGRVTRYGYDSAGRATSVTHAYGTSVALTTTTAYDLLDRTVSVTAPGSRVTGYAYDKLGQLTAMTEAVGTSLQRTTGYGYDAAGNQISTTDPMGTVTQYGYDALNRRTSTTEAVGAVVQRTTSLAFDAAGRVSSTTDARGNSTTFGYDADDRRTTVTNALSETTTYGFDGVGNMTSVTDPLSHTTAYAFDAANRLITVTSPLLNQTTYGYDANGNRTSVTDARGNTTSYGFDSLNRNTTVTNALLETTTTAYNANDEVTSMTNARGAVTAFTYDALGRLTTTTDPLSHSFGRTYDPTTGDMSQTTDALGNTTSYTYDALARVVTVTAPRGGVTTTLYDANDRVVSVTDPVGGIRSWGYDALNRVTGQTDANGYNTSFDYDANDNRIALTDASSNTTQFQYDMLNRIVLETDPIGKTSDTTYDAAGNLESHTDRLKRTIVYGYDDDNRRTSEIWLDASSSTVQTISSTFDAVGNLASITDSSGMTVYTYDALNRVTEVNQPFYFKQFVYDAAGNRIQVIDAQGGDVQSTYDLADQLIGRSMDSGAISVAITRDANGAEALLERYNGSSLIASTATTRDADGNVTAQVTTDSVGTTVASFAYVYDLAGRLTSKTDDGVMSNYTNDAEGQITDNNGTLIKYDGTGNRTDGTTIGANNRLLSDATWHYTYDDAGFLVSKSDGTTTWNYTYDHRGQMTSASDGTTTVTYGYDAFGNRISRSDGTTTENFAYDGWNPGHPEVVGNENFDAVADLDASGNLTMRRLYGDGFDELYARKDASGNVQWYVTDLVGSVRRVLDTTGSVIASSDFDAFGNLIAGAQTDRYGYTGREWDTTINLQFNRARVYDPTTGRWNSEDEKGFDAGDANLYRYVGNNVATLIDPSGMAEQPSCYFPPIPENPASQSLDNPMTRLWIIHKEESIPFQIDPKLSYEQQARIAFELRAKYRMEARSLMSDTETRDKLPNRNRTFEQQLEYVKKEKGLSGDAAYKEIIRSSQKADIATNELLNIKQTWKPMLPEEVVGQKAPSYPSYEWIDPAKAPKAPVTIYNKAGRIIGGSVRVLGTVAMFVAPFTRHDPKGLPSDTAENYNNILLRLSDISNRLMDSKCNNTPDDIVSMKKTLEKQKDEITRIFPTGFLIDLDKATDSHAVGHAHDYYRAQGNDLIAKLQSQIDNLAPVRDIGYIFLKRTDGKYEKIRVYHKVEQSMFYTKDGPYKVTTLSQGMYRYPEIISEAAFNKLLTQNGTPDNFEQFSYTETEGKGKYTEYTKVIWYNASERELMSAGKKSDVQSHGQTSEPPLAKPKR